MKNALPLYLAIAVVAAGIAGMTYRMFEKNQQPVPQAPVQEEQQPAPAPAALQVDTNDNLDAALVELDAVAGY